MKKVFFTSMLSILFIFLGCSKVNVIEEENEIKEKESLAALSPKTESLIRPTFKHFSLSVDLKMAEYVASILSKKERRYIRPIVYNGVDTTMYLVQYLDGWALLSADKRISPVLAKSETGTFDSQKGISYAKEWLDEMSAAISMLKKDSVEGSLRELEKQNPNLSEWLSLGRAAYAQSHKKTLSLEC